MNVMMEMVPHWKDLSPKDHIRIRQRYHFNFSHTSNSVGDSNFWANASEATRKKVVASIRNIWLGIKYQKMYIENNTISNNPGEIIGTMYDEGQPSINNEHNRKPRFA